MNRISPKKLLGSKWTAVLLQNKEKHFMVSEVEFDDDNNVISCSIEAIISKRVASINWQDLKNNSEWLHGWK